uniref:Uncharacterized protein n=1 Tax=Eutreptiella gymnastica TaxID=73025 RepID=A0A7S1IPL4_9EUGL
MYTFLWFPPSHGYPGGSLPSHSQSLGRVGEWAACGDTTCTKLPQQDAAQFCARYIDSILILLGTIVLSWPLLGANPSFCSCISSDRLLMGAFNSLPLRRPG